MKFLPMTVTFSLVLAGCLLEKTKDDEVPTAAKWGEVAQDFYPLVSIQSGRLLPDPDKCEGDWSYTRSIPYRIHGDTLDLRWNELVLSEDSDDLDTFFVAGVYTRSIAGNLVRGGWKLVDYRAWNSGDVLDSARQAALARWNFLYLGEEAYIGDNQLLFAYPRLWINALRRAEYELRNDESIAFQYVGKDSLRVTRDGETVGMKYKPFQFFRAHSSLNSRIPIVTDLTDSCTTATEVVDSTWLNAFLYDMTEKSAALGKAGGLSKFAIKHR